MSSETRAGAEAGDGTAASAAPGTGQPTAERQGGTVQPFRLSFMTHVAGLRDPRKVYRDSLELFSVAEQLGFHTGWVAQHHLTYSNGWLPSPFVFLANAAARTSRLRLGTAVVTLPLEHPVRVAEDAIVTDLVSDGRLELGLGHGGDGNAYQALDVDAETKRQRHAEHLVRLRSALRGEPVVGDLPVQPPASDLDSRLWQGTSSAAGAEAVAREGLGLLIARAPFGTRESAGVAQRPLVDSYRAAWHQPHAPQIGVSRAVYPTRSRSLAVRQVEEGLLRYVEPLVASGSYPAGATTEEYLRLQNVHIGSPDAVAESLAADQTLQVSTELICQLQPGLPSLGEAVTALELVATEVAPALGWRPEGEAR